MVTVDLQNDDSLEGIPDATLLRRWVESSLLSSFPQFEQTIRVVGETESQNLNQQYRNKNHPTNILSFPSTSNYLEYDCLGDLVICGPVVHQEAGQQGKELEQHWAHMVVHGMLHLQGYDHETDEDARKMESAEIKILSALGYSNPYND